MDLPRPTESVVNNIKPKELVPEPEFTQIKRFWGGTHSEPRANIETQINKHSMHIKIDQKDGKDGYTRFATSAPRVELKCLMPHPWYVFMEDVKARDPELASQIYDSVFETLCMEVLCKLVERLTEPPEHPQQQGARR